MSAKSDNLTSQNLTRHISYINLKKIIQYKVKANLRLYHSPFTQLVIQIQSLLFLRKGSLFIFLLGIESPLQRYLHLTSMSPRFIIFCWDSPKFSNLLVGLPKFLETPSGLIKIATSILVICILFRFVLDCS